MIQFRKAALRGLAGWLMLAGSATSASAALCGDVNGNGNVDPPDGAILVSRFGAPVPATDCGGLGTLQCGDYNKDGLINTVDLSSLARKLGGKELNFECTSPGTLECGGTLSGTITANRRMAGTGSVPACNTPCVIDGTVIVNPGVVVTFEPGTTCKALLQANTTDGSPSVLIILRDAKINAAGNGAHPIIFTSETATAVGGAGGAVQDWGGIVINGRAPVNFPGGIGIPQVLLPWGLPPGVTLYGGTESEDSSGNVRFTRVEFSGIEFSIDNELSVFTMNAVGRGTTIDHVQANVGVDDCIEWFGGNVRSRYMVATNCRDDSFDYDIGFTGGLQYGLVYQNAAIATGSGRHGIEGDNNEFGFNNLPRSNPAFCNLTVIGSARQPGSASGRSGANIRNGSSGRFRNILTMDWTAGTIDLDGTETIDQFVDPATGSLRPGLGPQAWKAFNVCSGVGCDVSTGSGTGSPPSSVTADQLYDKWGLAGLVDPADNTGAQTDPLLGGVAAGTPGGIESTFPTAADNRYFPPAATLGAPDCGLESPVFDPAPYIGAFLPGGGTPDNWLLTTGSWISFSTL